MRLRMNYKTHSQDPTRPALGLGTTQAQDRNSNTCPSHSLTPRCSSPTMSAPCHLRRQRSGMAIKGALHHVGPQLAQDLDRLRFRCLLISYACFWVCLGVAI